MRKGTLAHFYDESADVIFRYPVLNVLRHEHRRPTIDIDKTCSHNTYNIELLKNSSPKPFDEVEVLAVCPDGWLHETKNIDWHLPDGRC
mgnify:CR=1 FL=1